MIKTIKTDLGTISYNITIKKVKNINFRIKTDGIVYISAPAYVEEKYIQSVLIKNRKQILNSVEKFAKREKGKPENSFWLLGKSYQIQHIKSAENFAELQNNMLILYAENDTAEKQIINRFYEKKINEVYAPLVNRIYKTVKRDGIPFPSKISVKKMRSRWGSYSIKTGAVSLNSELIKYPIGCLKYVILHELAHFLHHGHNNAFYSYIYKYMPNYKAYEKILKKPYYEVNENE